MHRADAECLREKHEALAVIEDGIKDLESQLLVAQNLRENLLKDIALFRASHAPISRLPRDILPHIFEQWDDGDTFLRNRTLCLVSKTWFDVVWSSAAFWNPIVLRPGWEVDHIPSMCQYAALCHRRTKQNPVDIIIDFSSVTSYPSYIAGVLNENIERFNFIPSANGPAFQGSAMTRAVVAGEYPYTKIYQDIPKVTMRTLMAHNTEHVNRWRSLSLTIPDGLHPDSTHEILDETQGHLDNLVKMTIQGPEGKTSPVMESSSYPPTFFHGIQQFETNLPIRVLVSGSVLTHLDLKNEQASLHFLNNATSNFTALKTLELCLEGRHFHPTSRVYLPSLTYLMVSGLGYSMRPYLERVEAPSLARLHFSYPDSFDAPTTNLFQTITSLIIRGSPAKLRGRGTETPHSPTGAELSQLKLALRQSPELVSLRIRQDIWGDSAQVEKIIWEVRGNGYPLRRLQEVILAPSHDFMTVDETRLVIIPISSGITA